VSVHCLAVLLRTFRVAQRHMVLAKKETNVALRSKYRAIQIRRTQQFLDCLVIVTVVGVSK